MSGCVRALFTDNIYRNKMRKGILALAMMLTITSAMTAQDKKRFTLDDLLPGGSTFYSLYPKTAYLTWWGDKCIELDVDECSTVDSKTGKKTVLFSTEKINSILEKADAGKVHHLYEAVFPYADKTLVKVSTPKSDMLVDWEKGTVEWSQPKEKGMQNADWNAESHNLAYTSGHNLYVITADGKKNQVSKDGSLDIVYGESVHRNEFGIMKGTFWSPKGNLLAFYRMDQSMVTTYPQVDISTRCATMVPDKYPMAGETSHKVTVGIYNPATGNTIYLKAGDPTDRYFTNIAWSPDEKKVYMIELNRDQNRAELVRYNASDGNKEKVLFVETNDKYVEPTNPIMFLPWDDSKFIYQTRKDGYNHIYLYNTDGKQLAQLTKGEFEVMEVLGFNEAKKSIIYASNEENPIQRNLYAVDIKGRRKLLDDGKGYHYGDLSESGKYLQSNSSSPTTARSIDLIATDNGKNVNILTAEEPWKDYDVPEMKVGTIKAADGKTDLYYRLVLPTDFDPNKKYPAIVYVYGGPHAHNIDASRNWGVRGWDIWMAQKGYVMFCLDNRGSENRGLAFEQATFRQLGTEEMKDQLEGVAYLKSLPYVDSTRLGVHGWSFGGFMTTSLMTTYPDVFKVGVAGGPVIDWKYYEVMYGERYMDTPQANPEGYKNASLLNKAGNLKGRLMIIYGGNDPVCVPQQTLSFIRACIDAGTHPDLFTYPGDEHNMMGTDRIHLHEHISRYFDDFLK